jgi:hypothetical protein
VSEAVKRLGRVAAGLPLIFVGAVFYLHVVQPNYDPVHQFMSELALGESGWLMLVAFFALGGTMAALAAGFLLAGARAVVVVLLSVAAMGLVGAGLIRLDVDANVHIGLVALAFVTVALSMYLVPRCDKAFSDTRQMAISWSLAAAMGVSVALGAGLAPAGVGQRLSALFLILWSVWAGMRLSSVGARATG